MGAGARVSGWPQRSRTARRAGRSVPVRTRCAAWSVPAHVTASAAQILARIPSRPRGRTGRVFDVLDVPTSVGRIAVEALARGGEVGPVAAPSPDRWHFFVATRGAPTDEDEWWSCHLDCAPGSIADTPGLRWHCRDSFVLAPPSRHNSGHQSRWIHPPAGRPLPDSLRVLPVLVDACEEAGGW